MHRLEWQLCHKRPVNTPLPLTTPPIAFSRFRNNAFSKTLSAKEDIFNPLSYLLNDTTARVTVVLPSMAEPLSCPTHAMFQES
jgi:hypothetical protein